MADDDNRPRALEPKAAPTSGAQSKPSDSGESMMDKFRNFVTGGAQDTLTNAIKPKDMNYYHEDDGK